MCDKEVASTKGEEALDKAHFKNNFKSKNKVEVTEVVTTAIVEEESVDCTKCKKVFENATDVEKHKAECGEIIGLNKCYICEKEFISKVDIRKHMKSHENIVVNKCDICKKEFISKVDMRKHMKIHEDVIETVDEEDDEDCESPARKRGFQKGNKK